MNLIEILKGHEGESFYCSYLGEPVMLVRISKMIYARCEDRRVVVFYDNGSSCIGGECMLFPSKTQRDWDRWNEENNPKLPRVWSDIPTSKTEIWYSISCMDYKSSDPAIKSALALLKIYQLIEVGYGGNVTEKEIRKGTDYYTIISSDIFGIFQIKKVRLNKSNSIAFHTLKQAHDFLKYNDNIQLLRDYYLLDT